MDGQQSTARPLILFKTKTCVGIKYLYVRVVVLDKLRGGGGGEDQCMHVALHEIRDVLRDVVGHKHDHN